MSLADLASLASSVAVVVSLLFLGLQIRQTNRNQRSLMQQGRSARNVELLSRLSDPRVSDCRFPFVEAFCAKCAVAGIGI
jgi:hypothetical protein